MMNEMHTAAELARLLGDPIRLTLLQALVRKEATVSELRAATGASQSNLSNHLRLLRERDIIEGERHGRQIVYRIPSPAIAELVDALFMAAGNEESGPPPAGPLAEARTCYDHLAGRLGVTLLEGLAAKHAIVLPENSWTELELGPQAANIFARLGIDLEAAVRDGTRRRFAYACPDWSENGHFHIGGLIGASLCNRCLKTGWIERDTTTRGIKLTEPGKAALEWLTAQKS
jgi:DNA-binding transcriptional ArsR family regulator